MLQMLDRSNGTWPLVTTSNRRRRVCHEAGYTIQSEVPWHGLGSFERHPSEDVTPTVQPLALVLTGAHAYPRFSPGCTPC
jgi:hypothetical protein